MAFICLIAMQRKPFLVDAGLFPASADLSWIPDAGSNIPLYTPTETPDGSVTAFTFDFVPKAIMYNGIWYLENHGYTRSGNTFTFQSEYGTPLAPEPGAVIRAVR